MATQGPARGEGRGRRPQGVEIVGRGEMIEIEIVEWIGESEMTVTAVWIGDGGVGARIGIGEKGRGVTEKGSGEMIIIGDDCDETLLLAWTRSKGRSLSYLQAV